MKNTYIIENSFTGYRAEVTAKGEVPAVGTIKRHLRAAKASDCKSSTTITEKSTGDRYTLVEFIRGETCLVRVD